MARMTRREFLKASSAVVALSGLAGCASTGGAPTTTSTPGDLAPNRSGRRVIVIGGGWGGATAAKYVRMQDPAIEVVLLEPNDKFISCPFSNLVVSGVRSIESLTFGYDGLRKQHGVKIMRESEILACLAKGRSSKQIAQELNLSVRTVESHRQNIKRKLKLEGQAELIRYAVEHCRDFGGA